MEKKRFCLTELYGLGRGSFRVRSVTLCNVGQYGARSSMAGCSRGVMLCVGCYSDGIDIGIHSGISRCCRRRWLSVATRKSPGVHFHHQADDVDARKSISSAGFNKLIQLNKQTSSTTSVLARISAFSA